MLSKSLNSLSKDSFCSEEPSSFKIILKYALLIQRRDAKTGQVQLKNETKTTKFVYYCEIQKQSSKGVLYKKCS